MEQAHYIQGRQDQRAAVPSAQLSSLPLFTAQAPVGVHAVSKGQPGAAGSDRTTCSCLRAITFVLPGLRLWEDSSDRTSAFRSEVVSALSPSPSLCMAQGWPPRTHCCSLRELTARPVVCVALLP